MFSPSFPRILGLQQGYKLLVLLVVFLAFLALFPKNKERKDRDVSYFWPIFPYFAGEANVDLSATFFDFGPEIALLLGTQTCKTKVLGKAFMAINMLLGPDQDKLLYDRMLDVDLHR